MAFFTKFKKAKEAAVEHKKTAAAQDTKPPTAPYKHVPTHAAQDALNLQPTTLKPAELQARIAAARKRRASYSAYQSPMSARHSIYHSTDASRASSRAPSITLNPRSGAPSLKGKGPDEHSMDSVAKRARSQSYRHSSAMATPLTQAAEYFPQIPEGPLALPPPVASQRPRPPMSNRSSFAKKKSPLSNMAVDEDAEQVFSTSSNTSAMSSQSSNTDDSQHDSRNINAPRHFSKPNYAVQPVQPVVVDVPVRRRSRWSILPRRSMSVTAH